MPCANSLLLAADYCDGDSLPQGRTLSLLTTASMQPYALYKGLSHPVVLLLQGSSSLSNDDGVSWVRVGEISTASGQTSNTEGLVCIQNSRIVRDIRISLTQSINFLDRSRIQRLNKAC